MDRFLDWLDVVMAVRGLPRVAAWATVTLLLALTCLIGIVRVARYYGDFAPRGHASHDEAR
jgi:hypothetical protein